MAWQEIKSVMAEIPKKEPEVGENVLSGDILSPFTDQEKIGFVDLWDESRREAVAGLMRTNSRFARDIEDYDFFKKSLSHDSEQSDTEKIRSFESLIKVISNLTKMTPTELEIIHRVECSAGVGYVYLSSYKQLMEHQQDLGIARQFDKNIRSKEFQERGVILLQDIEIQAVFNELGGRFGRIVGKFQFGAKRSNEVNAPWLGGKKLYGQIARDIGETWRGKFRLKSEEEKRKVVALITSQIENSIYDRVKENRMLLSRYSCNFLTLRSEMRKKFPRLMRNRFTASDGISELPSEMHAYAQGVLAHIVASGPMSIYDAIRDTATISEEYEFPTDHRHGKKIEAVSQAFFVLQQVGLLRVFQWFEEGVTMPTLMVDGGETAKKYCQ